jgi:hypothetical protein
MSITDSLVSVSNEATWSKPYHLSSCPVPLNSAGQPGNNAEEQRDHIVGFHLAQLRASETSHWPRKRITSCLAIDGAAFEDVESIQ